ncbi:hypothetical protein B0H19DRAFT_1064717 [Mycena capillaripes]|nr:hypothetical protein B0H19DRAFT_1064717 [Mycena capillaripes]
MYFDVKSSDRSWAGIGGDRHLKSLYGLNTPSIHSIIFYPVISVSASLPDPSYSSENTSVVDFRIHSCSGIRGEDTAQARGKRNSFEKKAENTGRTLSTGRHSPHMHALSLALGGASAPARGTRALSSRASRVKRSINRRKYWQNQKHAIVIVKTIRVRQVG